jgi:hypothetical protein
MNDIQEMFQGENNVSDRKKVMERVRGLIAKANATDSPAEADAFRAKADALMLKYSIAQFELKDKRESASNVVPVDYDMDWYTTNPWCEELWLIMQRVAVHCRCFPVHWKYTGVSIPVVGTEADFEYFDMLFTNVSLEMSRGLEPHPSRDSTMVENLVKMKEAGMKWERIGELLIDIGQLDYYDRNMGVKFTKIYTDYCTEHDRPRLRVQPKTYQYSFVQGFKDEIVDRLFKIRRESQAAYDEDNESSGTRPRARRHEGRRGREGEAALRVAADLELQQQWGGTQPQGGRHRTRGWPRGRKQGRPRQPSGRYHAPGAEPMSGDTIWNIAFFLLLLVILDVLKEIATSIKAIGVLLLRAYMARTGQNLDTKREVSDDELDALR